METLVNSPIATEFDPHTLPFTPSDPLLDSLGLNHFTMIRVLNDTCPEFAFALSKAKVQNIKAKDICEGRGFLSHIISVNIQFSDLKSFSFVIKIPQSSTFDAIVDSFAGSAGSVESESSLSSASSSSDSSVCSTHNAECDFYDLFQQTTSKALPNIYHTRRNTTNQRGMIYMEDLSSRGSCVDIFSSLNAQQCKNVAVEIAQLQAKYAFMSSEQQKVIRNNECVHTSAHKQQFLDEFLSKIDNYGQEFADLLSKLQQFANTQFAKYALIDEVDGCGTLVHGDMWTNNVMFGKNKDGSLSDDLCALIDWQTAFEGNPLFDLSFLLASSTNAEVRREISTEVVDLYYKTLSEIYQQNNRQLNMTRQKAHKLFKLCQIQQGPVLGALMCFFGHNMEMNCPDQEILNAKMSIICERTRMVMRDAVDFVEELGLQTFNSSML